MSDLFKKPIICELKASNKLSCGFLVCALIPIISLATLIPKYPFIIGCLITSIVIYCVYYVRLYALRVNNNSIVWLRLHNNMVEIKQNNGIKAVHKIKKISMAPERVIIIPEKPGSKTIIDAESVDNSIYSAIRMEITINND